MQSFSKIAACCLLPMLLLFLLVGCSPDPEKTKQAHFQKAMIYVDKDDPKAAIIELRNAIQIDPKFADARYQLGMLYLKNGDIKNAFHQLQRAASLDPTNIDARLKTAEFLLMNKDRKDARKMADALLKDAPENVNVLALAANLELIDGNFTACEALLNKAVSLNPDLDRLYSIRGRMYTARKNFTKAETAFKKALEVNPDKLANYQMLYTFYQSQKNRKKAEETIREMIAKFPDTPVPLIMLASMQQQMQQLDKAEETLLKAVQRFPNDTRTRLILADFYRKNGQADKAESAYLAAMEHADNPLEIKGRLADYYFDQKQFDKARTTMEEIFAENAKNGWATLVKAKFLIKEGDSRQAATLLTRMARDYPRWAEVFFVNALADMNMGNMELAQTNAMEAIKKKPGESKYHSLLAMLNLKTRDFDTARQEAAIALKLNPGNFQAALLLAKSFLFSGDYDNAIKILEEMRKKAPENVEILGNLGLAYIGKKELDKAETMFQELLKVQPGNTLALMNIVRINGARGKDKAELIDIIKKQVAKAPDSVGDLILLGTVLMQEKQFDEALSMLRKARQLAPLNPRPYMLTASIYGKQDKIDEAIAEYNALLTEHPRDIQAMMGVGTLLEQKGDTAAARKQYEKILEINPDFAPAANNLAWIIAESPEPDLGEALRLAMIARQQMPDEVNIIDTAGWVHYKRKSYGLARNEFAHAVELQPDTPVFRYHLALALYGEGKTEEALRELQTALAADENFIEREDAQKLLNKWQQGQ